MDGDVDLAPIGALLGDPGRARMLDALLGGRSLSASRLAEEAGVAPSTASSHLSRLVDGGLLLVDNDSRPRLFPIASPDVAGALEALAAIAPAQPVRSLRQSSRADAMRAARTCYDHLAGRAGVELMAALLDRGLIANGDGAFDPATADGDRPAAPGRDVAYRLTPAGEDVLSGLGIELAELHRRRRPLIRYCVEWSERRHHLAGGLGAALTARMFELEWLRRLGGRAVRVTPSGASALREAFGLELGTP